jgi:hypothetical protein
MLVIIPSRQERENADHDHERVCPLRATTTPASCAASIETASAPPRPSGRPSQRPARRASAIVFSVASRVIPVCLPHTTTPLEMAVQPACHPLLLSLAACRVSGKTGLFSAHHATAQTLVYASPVPGVPSQPNTVSHSRSDRRRPHASTCMRAHMLAFRLTSASARFTGRTLVRLAYGLALIGSYCPMLPA